MKCKIIIALLSLLLPAITHCKAQTIYDQNRILRLQSLYNLAEKCFLESQYDLCEEYISSPQFINSVAGHISESLVGLHDLDDAVRDVASFDSKRKIKVYKDNSLMRI